MRRHTAKLVIGAILLATILIGWGISSVAEAVHYVPPQKYNQAFTLHFSIYDSNSPWQFYETAPAADDIKIRKDGGAWARATNSVTDLDHTMTLLLTATEMSAAVITVDVNDETAPPLFGSDTWVIYTHGNASAQNAFDLDSATVTPGADSITASVIAADAITSSELATSAADEIADDLLDELLTGGEHRVKNSVAWYIRKAANSGGGEDAIIVEEGTAQAGTANTITLAADASATNDIYSGMLILLDGNTGSPQSRVIVGYTGSTKVATIDKNWVTNPDATTTYDIVADAGSFYSDTGTAQAGANTTVTLAATASSVDDLYNGFFVRIISGTGANQTRTITDYNGTTKVATISTGSTDWGTNPDNTSVYVVVPGGNIVSDSPLPPLTPEQVYDTLTLYDVATASDVNTATAIVDINAVDLLQADYTGYTSTPSTLGWLWKKLLDLP